MKKIHDRPGAATSQRDDERKRPRLPMCLSPEAIERLKALALETGMSRSRIVEALILSPLALEIAEAYKKASEENDGGCRFWVASCRYMVHDVSHEDDEQQRDRDEGSLLVQRRRRFGSVLPLDNAWHVSKLWES